MKLAIVVLLSLAACGKKSPGEGKVASCYSESVKSCREYRDGNLALGTESLQKLCTVVVSTAKFSEAACPAAGIIGRCKKDEGTDIYYAGYELQTPAEIEASCKQGGGTFTTK